MSVVKENKPSAKFYLVDDVLVCVWNDGQETVGFVVNTGYPYPPLKAVAEGNLVSVSHKLTKSKM